MDYSSRLGIRLNGNGRQLWDLFWDLNDEKTAGTSRDALFTSLPLLFHINEWLLGVIYLSVLAYSIGLGLAILHYGLLLRKLENWPKLAAVLVQLVRPWTAEWYLRLSRMLLPTKTAYIQVDVMTKADILYRGRLEEHHLAQDGSLVSITLKEPRKFKRQEFLESRKASQVESPPSSLLPPNPEVFWTSINGQFFVILSSDIMTLNVKYLDVPAILPVLAKTKVETASRILAQIARAREAGGAGSNLSTRLPSSRPRGSGREEKIGDQRSCSGEVLAG
jgi:hypothetical protein